MTKIISPSILSANFLELKKEIGMLNESSAEWIHIDVMDGVFVPNISFGMPIIKQIRDITPKIMDVHLMIENPDKYLEEFKLCGADILTVHYEAVTHLHRTISYIKSLGMKAGVSLNPSTPISFLEDVIKDLDLVLLMSVNPGFGGQSFIENTYKKLTSLKKLIETSNSKAIIEIDGGVSTHNAGKLFLKGADVLVAGNAVFKSENPKEMIEKLLNN